MESSRTSDAVDPDAASQHEPTTRASSSSSSALSPSLDTLQGLSRWSAMALFAVTVTAASLHAYSSSFDMHKGPDRVCLRQLEVHDYPMNGEPVGTRWAEVHMDGCWPLSEAWRLRRCVAAKNADARAVLTAITCAEMEGELPRTRRHFIIRRYEYGKDLSAQMPSVYTRPVR